MAKKQDPYMALLDEILSVVAYKLLNRANENLDKSGISDTGNLRGSGTVEPIGDEEKLVIWRAGYSGDVEFGTSPHWPPHEAIYLWVRRKMKISDEKKARSIAYAIQHEIANHGTTGRHFVRDAIDELGTS